MAHTDIISPEIILLEKLEDIDRSLPPALWQQMRSDVALADSAERNNPDMLPAVRQRKRVFLRDFVDKAVSLPLKIIPGVPQETADNLYRLHLFCCQRAIHCPEVRHNPFRLGFEALREMKTALEGIMISYRLIDPSCPYSWDRKFFENNIIADKEADGRTVIRFCRIPPEIIPKAVTEEMVTDWLIYRAYDNNGIRTLMDYKNNLLTLPDYQRGGSPESEFSRFERKMQEQRNREEKHKNQELDLEFRKTLVKSVAEQTASRLMNMGLSDLEILEKAYNGDLNTLIDNRPGASRRRQTAEELPPQPAFNAALGQETEYTPIAYRNSEEERNAPWLAGQETMERLEYGSPRQNHNNARALPAPRHSHDNAAPQNAGANSKQDGSPRQSPHKSAQKSAAKKDSSPSLIDDIIARFLDE